MPFKVLMSCCTAINKEIVKKQALRDFWYIAYELLYGVGGAILKGRPDQKAEKEKKDSLQETHKKAGRKVFTYW